MKIGTKAFLAMFAALAALPGCGKKNDQPATVAAAPAVQNIGSGQCATVSYNSPTTLTFYGQLSGGSGIIGNLSAYGYGATNGGGYDGFVSRYTKDGVLRWTNQYGTTGDDWGWNFVLASNGTAYVAFRHILDDFVLAMPRGAQVVYPKDPARIVGLANLGSGARVAEAGVGSGALTCSLLRSVGDPGHVYSYERRDRKSTRLNSSH